MKKKAKAKIIISILTILIFFVIIGGAILYFVILKDSENISPSSQTIKRLGASINDDWALEALHFKQNMDSISSPSVKVAIIDSGLNIEGSNILQGYNAIDNCQDVKDEIGHGTNIYILLNKIAPNVKILPIKVISSDGKADQNTVAKAIRYAINQKVDIINLSIGMNEKVQCVLDEINTADEQGIIVVCAAGNNGNKKLDFPASCEKTISVCARDINNIDLPLSNVSLEKKSFSAPGIHIEVKDGVYVSGTSYSAAYATAAVAMLRSVNSSIKREKVFEILQKSAVDGNEYSFGLIQLDKLLNNETFSDVSVSN